MAAAVQARDCPRKSVSLGNSFDRVESPMFLDAFSQLSDTDTYMIQKGACLSLESSLVQACR